MELALAALRAAGCACWAFAYAACRFPARPSRRCRGVRRQAVSLASRACPGHRDGM